MIYHSTPAGVFYICKITGTWQPVAIINGVFYPIALVAF